MGLGKTTVTSLGKHGFWHTDPKKKLRRDFDNPTDRRKKQQADLKKKLEHFWGNRRRSRGRCWGVIRCESRSWGVRTVYRDYRPPWAVCTARVPSPGSLHCCSW
eukprot:gene13875-biopygen14132